MLELANSLVVYLYLVNYGRSRADDVAHAIGGFLSVSVRCGTADPRTAPTETH